MGTLVMGKNQTHTNGAPAEGLNAGAKFSPLEKLETIDTC